MNTQLLHKNIAIGAVFLLVTMASAVAAVTISTFGTNIQPADLQGSWTSSYNSATSVLTDNDGPGNGFSDYTGPVISNITGATLLQLTASLSTNPNSTFQITLEDNSIRFARANFAWASFSNTPTAVSSSLSLDSGFNPASIIGWNLYTGGIGSPISATFLDLSAVAIPEPSASELVLFATLMASCLAFRQSLGKY